jgi:hypothetical protein
MSEVYFPEPFLTVIGKETDPLYDSPEEELSEFFLRQNLIHDFVEGTIPADVVLDCLAEQGIEPTTYIEEVEASVEWVCENQIIIPDARLWLPPTQD